MTEQDKVSDQHNRSVDGQSVNEQSPINHNTTTDMTNSHNENLEILHNTISSLQLQVDDLTDKMLRLSADHENTRKRYEKQISDAAEYSVTNFAKDLMSVMDNLSRALEYQPESMSSELKNVLLGVEMTMSELNSVFEKNKISAIAPKPGDKFDYNAHYAISHVESDEHAPGLIVNIMQPGYKIKERLLRPAAVSVSKDK
jgi:molecular chaperone GrpE